MQVSGLTIRVLLTEDAPVDAQTQQISYVSPAATELFGYPSDAFLVDKHLWRQVVHPEDRPRLEAAWQAVSRGEPFDIEYRALRPDGTVKWINDRGMLIRG